MIFSRVVRAWVLQDEVDLYCFPPPRWTDKRTGQTKRVLWSNKTVITDHPDVVREVWEWAYVEVDIRELAKLKPQ